MSLSLRFPCKRKQSLEIKLNALIRPVPFKPLCERSLEMLLRPPGQSRQIRPQAGRGPPVDGVRNAAAVVLVVFFEAVLTLEGRLDLLFVDVQLEAARGADVIVALTTTAMSNSTPGSRAMRQACGGPMWLMEELTVEILCDGGCRTTMKDIEEIPVVEGPGSKKILGMVRRKDIIAAYNREVLKKESGFT